MPRINTSRQTIAAASRVTASKINAQRTIAQHVLDTTVSASHLTAQIVTCKAGRSFTVGSLKVRKGDKLVLVASKFQGRYYVCANGQWSTSDQAVIAKCNQALQVAA